MGDYLGFDPMNMVSVDEKNKIHPFLTTGENGHFKFESGTTVIENINEFKYIINSAFDSTIAITIDGKGIDLSITEIIPFNQLEISGSQFSLEASRGDIQIANNQLLITIKKTH